MNREPFEIAAGVSYGRCKIPATKKSADPKPQRGVYDPPKRTAKLKIIGGSVYDDWNNIVANQVGSALWLGNSDAEQTEKQHRAAIAALIGIAPQDELEGMIAAQLVACHNAAMECYRRAMIGEQTLEGRHENLGQANKLSRTYSTLLEALSRHRGKGAQKVIVEHVHVHAGGQAIVGMVETPGGGDGTKSEDQPHARQIAHAPGVTMRSADTPREPVPIAGNGEWQVPDARRNIAGRTEGE